MSKTAIANMKDNKNSESVKVVIRCRPLNKKEMQAGNDIVVNMNLEKGEIFVTRPGSDEPPKHFTFDHCYDWTAK